MRRDAQPSPHSISTAHTTHNAVAPDSPANFTAATQHRNPTASLAMEISPEELVKNEFWLKKLMMAMSVVDANKDGFISKADFDLVIERYHKMGSSEEHLERLKEAYAVLRQVLGVADDDTRLTYEETIENFGKGIITSTTEELAMFITAHFETIDSDGNGEISFREWTEMYKAVGINTEFARASFDAMDANGDGIVSREEFTAYGKEYFFSAEDKLKSSILFGPLN